MAVIVFMPNLGFGMTEGTLVRWAVPEGGAVNKGDVLAEIENDKATVEIEATQTGIVHKHLVRQNAIISENDPIAVISEPGEAVDVRTLLGGEEAVEKPVYKIRRKNQFVKCSLCDCMVDTSQLGPEELFCGDCGHLLSEHD